MTDGTRDIVQKIVGYTWRDPTLLELALTHASVADSRVRSNERLEFLGDAVLGLVVCEHIYSVFPSLLEGEMTKIKSTVVSRQCCAAMTLQLGLAEHLSLGKGMRVHETLPQSLAAAVLEAIVAAIYLDGGLEPARTFLLPLVTPMIHRAFESGHQENFKSILQQHAQQRLDDTPSYVVLEQKGPDHAKHFHVCVQIGSRRFPSSWGPSKKQAEQQAALLALYELGVTVADEQGRVRIIPGGRTPESEEPEAAGAGEDPGEASNGAERPGGHADGSRASGDAPADARGSG
ncbi:MAG: ribonuclease III [Phycisphaerales bacterium]